MTHRQDPIRGRTARPFDCSWYWGPGALPGAQLLDGGADLGCGVIDDNHVTVGQVVPATRLNGAVDGDVAGLDGDACLRTVLHQASQFEELSEPDASSH